MEGIMVNDPALRVRFGIHENSDYHANWIQEVENNLADELSDLKAREGVASVSVSESGIGTGASGPAFEVAIQLLRTFADDATRLVTLGGWILWLADRVKAKRHTTAMMEDAPTLGAVAAARVAGTIKLDGFRLLRCSPMHGDAVNGTDDRMTWLALFDNAIRGETLAVFISPSGILLGQVVVPKVVFDNGTGYIWRTPEEIARAIRDLNPRG
jgi:hypothetical protein